MMHPGPTPSREIPLDGRPQQNLEFKARLADLEGAHRIAVELGATNGGELIQIDTYYKTQVGRLKLRKSDGKDGELIFYERAEDAVQRWSTYRIVAVGDAESLHRLLETALGVRGMVRKHRQVYLWNQCRIHLDTVEQLGLFIEFEVRSGSDAADNRQRMERLLTTFACSGSDAVSASYIDLLGL